MRSSASAGRVRGLAPPFVCLGDRIAYRLRDVEAYEASLKVYTRHDEAASRPTARQRASLAREALRRARKAAAEAEGR